MVLCYGTSRDKSKLVCECSSNINQDMAQQNCEYLHVTTKPITLSLFTHYSFTFSLRYGHFGTQLHVALKPGSQYFSLLMQCDQKYM